MKTVRRPPYPKWNPGYFPCSSLTPLPLSSRRPSVSFGGFGLTRTIEEVRSAATGPGRRIAENAWRDSETLATLPEMRRGGIAAALVKVSSCVLRHSRYSHGEVRTQDNAYASAHGQLAYYRLMDAMGEMRRLRTSGDVTTHMRDWEEADSHEGMPVGWVLGMEGDDAIRWPEQVREWWEDGLRVISLSHYGLSAYSHGTGTGTDGGLTPLAPKLLREMDALGIILDVSHTSDESVRQELEVFSGPVLASHQNCRALAPGERQFPDELLTAVIERGGVIGASMDTWMLHPDGTDWTNIRPRREIFPRSDVTLEDYVNHIDYVCQLAGNSHHAAIGGDTDGQGGRDCAPYEIDTVADYQKVGDVLERLGYAEADIENILWRNWQRFFEKWLPEE